MTWRSHVRDEMDDARLVAVGRARQPRNKDRPESRRAFAAKSAAYLQRGVGLIVLDIVTESTVQSAQRVDPLSRPGLVVFHAR